MFSRTITEHVRVGLAQGWRLDSIADDLEWTFRMSRAEAWRAIDYARGL